MDEARIGIHMGSIRWTLFSVRYQRQSVDFPKGPLFGIEQCKDPVSPSSAPLSPSQSTAVSQRPRAQLGVSKGSLSHSIREIEERLGVRLLNRTTRSVAPTEAGERMLARLRPLFDDLEATVDEVNEFRDRPAGHLRLTMPRPVASFVIAPLLARFVSQYPEIIVDISVSPALTDIVAGRYDAGFRVGNRIGRDMIAVRVTDALRFVVAASPEYLARHPAPKSHRTFTHTIASACAFRAASSCRGGSSSTAKFRSSRSKVR